MTPFVKNDSIFNDKSSLGSDNHLDEQEQAGDFDISDLDINMISTDKFNLEPPNDAVFEDENLNKKTSFFFNKNVLIFSMIWVIIFLFICVLFLFNGRHRSSSDDIEELPIIKAEAGPIKEMVKDVKVKDSKKVYSYITSDVDSDDQIEKAVNSAEVEYDSIKMEVPDCKEDDLEDNQVVSKYSDIDEYSDDVLKSESQQVRPSKLKKRRRIKDTLRSLNSLSNLDDTDEVVHLKKKKPLKNFFKKKRKPEADSTSAATNMNIFIPYSEFDSERIAFDIYEDLITEHPFIKGYGYKIVKNGSRDKFKYRIFIGPFSSIDSANYAVDKMKAVGIKVVW